MNRSQERAGTRSKRTPRGAARAKRRRSHALRSAPKVVGQIVGDTLIVDFDAANPEHVMGVTAIAAMDGAFVSDLT